VISADSYILIVSQQNYFTILFPFTWSHFTNFSTIRFMSVSFDLSCHGFNSRGLAQRTEWVNSRNHLHPDYTGDEESQRNKIIEQTINLLWEKVLWIILFKVLSLINSCQSVVIIKTTFTMFITRSWRSYPSSSWKNIWLYILQHGQRVLTLTLSESTHSAYRHCSLRRVYLKLIK